jgi:hypothetical protein
MPVAAVNGGYTKLAGARSSGDRALPCGGRGRTFKSCRARFSAKSRPAEPAKTFRGTTFVYESPRLRRVCLVCSYARARLAVLVVSVRYEHAGGWRFVSRARHVGRAVSAKSPPSCGRHDDFQR